MICESVLRFENAGNDNERSRIGVAINQVAVATRLTEQIIEVLLNGWLLIALIGLRSLLEEVINTKYTFDHPRHQKDLQHTYQVCSDYLNKVNEENPMYNRLHDKPVAKRAEEADLTELYKKTYSSLCNYTHLSLRKGQLIEEPRFRKYSALGFISALEYLHDIQKYLSQHFEIARSVKITDQLIDFRKRVESYMETL